MVVPALSLYFHIPFCTKKCPYCNFYVLPDDENLKTLLSKGFELEWEQTVSQFTGSRIATIYFGGGTPSLFGPSRIATVLDRIRNSVPFLSEKIEITLEANPEHLTPSLAADYAAAGINRMSLGVQSLSSDLLHILGRKHTPAKAIEAIESVYTSGIDNISIDLMYDLPDQGLAEWRRTLKTACSLPIRHLSLYNLTFEPHTLFFKQAAALKPRLPDQEISAAMYQDAMDILPAAGFHQYEISAFCQPGSLSQHNSGYWLGRPFWGFGPSAFSYWKGKRFRTIPHLRKYVSRLEEHLPLIDFEEELLPEARRRELLVIQLRLIAGLSLDSFQQLHGALDQETNIEIGNLLQETFLKTEGNTLSLTRKGILFYDHVASRLV